MRPLFLFYFTFLFVTRSFSQEQNDAVIWDSTGKFYEKNETASRFPGDKAAYHNFITHLLKTLSSYAGRLPGIKKATYDITLVFTVDTSGLVKAVSADCKPAQPELEKKTKQLIEESPPWIPATVSGNRVKVYRKQLLSLIME